MSDTHHALATAVVQAVPKLDIDDYHRCYLQRMAPAMDYYCDIYARCMQMVADRLGKHPNEATLIDYGGGHGLLSIMAKAAGWKNVIYTDYDPAAMQTAQALARAVGTGADHMLCTDVNGLRQWIADTTTTADALLGMDVIEHIYDLDTFFATLGQIPVPHLLFTTASNPDNPFARRRLHHAMQGDESGTNEQPNFLTLRQQHIEQRFTHLAPDAVIRLAKETRGMTYEDIDAFVGSGTPRPPHIVAATLDPYNTCDPRTGSWTERLLPIGTYEKLLHKNHYSLEVCNGWYNRRHTFPRRVVADILNKADLRSTAPFIILNATKE